MAAACLGLAVAPQAVASAGTGGTVADGSATPSYTHPLRVDSRWFPLVPGTQFVYDGTVVDETGSHHHRVVFTVTDLVKKVDGVRTWVVWDRDIQDGELQEAELALFAQDDAQNVHSLAEYPEEYEDGAFAGAPSTWVSGLDGARGGVLVPGHPVVGTPRFTQGKALQVEFFDVGKVVQTGAHVCVPAGCFDHVTVVEEWSPIAPADGRQLKYYARGVGLVQIGALGGDSQETLRLTAVRHLGPTALAEARAAALRLDRHGHRVSDVWARTPAAYQST